jgi:phosphoglycerate dehydrogenase-like enzyme
MLRCAALDDYQDATRRMGDWARLAGKVELRAFTRHIAGRDALVAAIEDCEIVIAMRERTPFDRALFERLPRLRLLITTGMRNASIDLEAAAARGVTVCGTEAWPGTTAELAWGLILSLLRYIPEEAANLRRGGPWQTTIGRDLSVRRLGVVGLGNLGTRVARVGRAFGMPVAGWSRSLTPAKAEALDIEHCAELDELLRVSDIVTIHLTLTRETRGLIDARRLGLMKPDALLVNTARGPIVDEAALAAALESGRLAGAALDVYGEEPLPADHPFRRLPNVLATPHLGYVTERTYENYFKGAIEDIEAWLAGTPVRVLAKPA